MVQFSECIRVRSERQSVCFEKKVINAVAMIRVNSPDWIRQFL